MRLAPRSVRVRLALWYAGTLAALLVLCAFGVLAWTRHSRLAELDHALDEGFELIEETIELLPDGRVRLRPVASDSILEESVPPFEARAADGRLLLRHPADEDFELVAAAEAPGIAARVGRPPESIGIGGGLPVRREVRRLRAGTLDVVVVSARSERRMRRELRELARMLAIAIPVAVAAAGMLGWLLARRALAPVDRIVARVRGITADRLSDRIAVRNPDDELGRLAATCNEMIARLERSFAQLRRFTADASHELRTPLTALRSVGEVGLRESRPPGEYREVIGSMLEEVDRLARLVDALLLLSRADLGAIELRLEPVDLVEVAKEAAEVVHVLADEKRQPLAVAASGPLPVRADRVLLRQAIVNLVDNAIRHGPPGQPIRLVGRFVDGHAAIEVIDAGPGIAREHHERIFERFYRVDRARSRELGGAGLGLAIARSTVEAHGGRIELESGIGRGATFRLLIPRVDATRGDGTPGG